MKKLTALKSAKGKVANDSDRYFQRDEIVNKIFIELENKEHLLLSAPRRIGKSTIAKYITNNPKENQIIKYMIVQSIDTSEEFFKNLYNQLINDKEIFNGIEGYIERAKATTRAYISKVSGVSLQGNITINPKENIDYYQELLELINSLTINKKIIIFIDEFPDALNNIVNKDKSLAIKFLQKNRDLRINFSDKNLQFAYTGSTGLSNVVKKIDRLDLINDIVNIKIPQLTFDEAKELLQRLILGYQKHEKSFNIDDETIKYILGKITWKIPYYMQIILSEIYEHYDNTKEVISASIVDDVFQEIVKSSSNHSDYFENWKSRLKKVFKNDDYTFVIEVLNYIAKNDFIEYSIFNDLGVKHKVKEHKYILDVLEHDGYISEDNKKYGFNSILLKEWWYINVAI